MSYCVDCKYYIPGGGNNNCSHPSRKRLSYVCAIQQACYLFTGKEEQEQVKEQANQKPINLRTKKKQRRFKSDKCNNEQTL